MELDDKNIIGSIIKKYRIKHQMTQAELAEKVGLSEKHLGQIERGAFQPNIINFFKIINVLNINLSNFGFSNSLNNQQKELLALINSSTDEEINLFIDIIKNIKNFTSNN